MLARYFITLLWAGSLAFAQTTTTPNMNLALPVVGQEIGPQWATDLNNAFTVVDQHDHTPGKGVQIPPAGLNINSALTFNDNPATNLSEVDLTNGSAASSNSGALSVAPGGGTGVGDLYYTDFAGNQIQLTKSGQVNVVASSIPGESYSAGTFIWDQTQSSLPTTPANFDIGSITLRPNIAATTVGTTLTPPSTGIYTIGLPVPMAEGYSGVPNFVNMDNSGQQVNTYYLDNSTLNVSGNAIQVKDGGITRAKLSSSLFLTPTLSVATASGTGSGGFGSSQQGWLVNTTTSVTAAMGDTYTNNSHTYTVQAALTAQTGQDLFLSGTGAFSGTTLTRATGSGSATITFTNAAGNALNPEATYLYTTPTSPSPLYLDIQMIGGGGGGGAAGNVSWVNSTAGGSTIFGTLLALSNGGGATNSSTGGSGGTNLTTTPWTLSGLAQIIVNLSGSSGSGGSGTTAGIVGGNGGTSPFGGAGGGGGDLGNGQAAIANSGSGGGGHGGDGASSFSGAGGGSAGYLHYRINSPSSTYLYAIGVGGAFSTSGSGLHGGTGGSGVIIISEDYQ